eukprot:TRINITY_DN14677_c0_g1_i3.p1 TRINITY_DN14677_c0_g1~~TRINITY_DN14677_c0_g1_i3.p1  ORF type:complete len:301 (-),score=48.79 TRINITY_DN14677_c0_g1_i3:10-912(-)
MDTVRLVCFQGFYFFFFQAEDGIRDVERSRGLGDVYKRQGINAEYMGNNKREALARTYVLCDYYEMGIRTLFESKARMKMEDLVSLAAEFANREANLKFRHKYFCLILEYVMCQSENDIKMGLSLIDRYRNEDQNPILSINDLLPFISPRIKLKEFAQLILSQLKTIDSSIEEKKKSMKHTLDSFKLINNAKKMLCSRKITIQPFKVCDLCQIKLMSLPFVAFNCSHAFHFRCLLLWIDEHVNGCLLYTSDAADDTPCVDLGGRRIIKKKKKIKSNILRSNNRTKCMIYLCTTSDQNDDT